MLTENDVVLAVSLFLKSEGYSIEQALNTSQQGIDIEATSSNGTRCFVEAKGATSSKEGSKRYGQEFNNNQIKTHIGMALLKSFQTLHQHPSSEVIIALPGNAGHRKVLDSMLTPIKNSGIKVFLINGNTAVQKYI
jgi:hypothetical protein